ncbi:MAG: hypothetical protein GYB66_03550 [Chloroflexi bacterium]|nr:hypothetical protein [Chloroflexota bacterium]
MISRDSKIDWLESPRIVTTALSILPGLLAIASTLIFMSGELSDEQLGQVLLLLAGSISIGVFITWIVAGARLQPLVQSRSHRDQVLRAFEVFTQRLEAGDLRAKVELPAQLMSERSTFGTLAGAFNRLMPRLDSTIADISSIANNVSAKVDGILAATNEQIGTATEQDTSVMETSSTVQEVRATVTETAERAAAVADMAQTSVNVSKAGQQAVSDAIDGMNLIRRRVESIADNILVLSEHTQQIGEIIATVSALADQSKLLALNASVEAARAGEEGKGFAVVAMEVRNLAEQSREATNQVRDILSEIQQATNSAVMVTEEGTKGVDAGVELVNRAGESIRDLASTIEEAAYAAVQIAASTRQQTVGVDQLSMAMQNIRQATAHATTSTMTVERSARELMSMSRSLNNLLDRYRVHRDEAE